MGHRHVFPISMKKTLVKMTFKLILNMYTSPNSLRYVLFKLKFGGLILSKFNHFLYGKNKTLVKNVKASPSSFLHLLESSYLMIVMFGIVSYTDILWILIWHMPSLNLCHFPISRHQQAFKYPYVYNPLFTSPTL